MTWGVPAAVGAFSPGNVDTPMTVTPVAGIVAGMDLRVWYAARPGSGVAGVPQNTTGPAWVRIFLQNSDAGSIGGALFGRQATGSDACTISTTAGSSVSAGAVMWRLSGGPPTPVGHVSSQTFAASNATTITTTALTPTQPACIAYALAVRNWNNDTTGVTSWPSGSGMTTLFTLGSSYGSNELALIGGYVIQTTAVSIGAGLITPTSGASLRNILLMTSEEPDTGTAGQPYAVRDQDVANIGRPVFGGPQIMREYIAARARRYFLPTRSGLLMPAYRG